MKCLRPQIRSDADQFTIGAEDLVHETAVLANVSHEHIIKLHGRASGRFTDAFMLNDGYFILLDKLEGTLHDRIEGWREADGIARGPSTEQLGVARDIADAVAFLHGKNIVFRDLKPANVGFDGRGVLKLFDFGFACGLPTHDEAGNPDCLLYDRCGTPRYMAPEVGLERGYGAPADAYAFGILLWEICALVQPFAAIRSPEEFERAVFRGGQRPPVGARWPRVVVGLLAGGCWETPPERRPSMQEIKASLAAAAPPNAGSKSKVPKRMPRLSSFRRRSDEG